MALSLAWFHSILLLYATSGTTCIATFYFPEEICYHTCFVFVQINTHIYNIVFWVFMRGDVVIVLCWDLRDYRPEVWILGTLDFPRIKASRLWLSSNPASPSIPTVMYWELVRIRSFFAARSWGPQLFTVPQLQRQLIVSHRRARRRSGWGKTLAAPLNHHGRGNTFKAPNGEARSPK